MTSSRRNHFSQVFHKKLFLFFSLLFFLLLMPAGVLAKNSLWQVRSGEHTMYLLGSLHVLKKDAYPLPPFFEEVYAASGTLVF